MQNLAWQMQDFGETVLIGQYELAGQVAITAGVEQYEPEEQAVGLDDFAGQYGPAGHCVQVVPLP